MIDLATGELAPLYGEAVRRVRQPPRGRLPVLLGGVQARRPAARPRGPGRRQGHPRHDHRAPVRVRHPHRPLLRPGPRPPDARQDRPAVPTPPRRQSPPLPARPGHLLPDPPRRDDPRLGQPMCRDCYDYESAVLFNAYAGELWRRFITYLPRHLARLAGVTQKTLHAPASHPVRQGRRVPGTRRRPLPRRDPPGRDRRGLPAAARSGTPPPCCATPSTRPPPPSASSSTTTARP